MNSERNALWAMAYITQTVTVQISARRRGKSVEHRESALFAEFARQIAVRGSAGDLALCPHLSFDNPSPAYWLAWHPEMLRCPPCVRALVAGEVTGEKPNSDLICDRCGFVSHTLDEVWSGVGQLETRFPLPVAVICGLCNVCALSDGL